MPDPASSPAATPPAATPYADRIRARLAAALQPTRLDLVDESHLHRGHAGHHPGGETHFRLTVVSAAFAGKSRVERQRLVYGALAAEMAERVHALSIVARAPGEA